MDNLMLSISETDVLHSYNITKTDLGQKMIILKQILSEIDIDDVTINYATTLLYSFSLKSYGNPYYFHIYHSGYFQLLYFLNQTKFICQSTKKYFIFLKVKIIFDEALNL